MATALRPRASAAAMISRYGSHALALGARPGCNGVAGTVDTSALVAAFGGPESVDTSPEIAGFGFDSLGRPRPRTPMRAAFRYALTVSRRMPVVCWMRDNVQPKRPSARICCCFSSSKTLLMPASGTHVPRPRQRLGRLS
jgi:hypothetical protein